MRSVGHKSSALGLYPNQRLHKVGLLIFFILQSWLLAAQYDFVIIDSILVKGLKKTSRNVVLKELDIISGDTLGLDQLAKRLSSNEKRLQSIGLFTVASINVKNWNTDINTCDIEIIVHENWYIYPYLIFELADRNFNVWRKEQHYSLDRVNFGGALNHINLTGNKDKLKLKIQRGYTRKYEISYDFPYLKKRWGLSANVLYAENREIAYLSINNKPVFYKNLDEKKIFFQHRASLTLLNRTSATLFQSLRLEYIFARVDTAIASRLNPNYLGNGRASLNYFLLDYYIKFDRTLYPLYPVGGFKLDLNIRKEGLGYGSAIDNAWVSVSGENHFPIKPWLILGNRVKLKYNLLRDPLPYIFNNGIGYKQDNIIGYQLYVLDGRNFVLWNNALKCRLLDKNFDVIKYIGKRFRDMNLKLFLRASFDMGYSRDPVFGDNNKYSNTWQYGYGPGVDLILFNNFSVSLEYGITRFGEHGLFFESGFNF